MKNEIEWISCKEKMPQEYTTVLVIGKQKYEWKKDWDYFVDVAMTGGDYIDDYFDTFNDWCEGQETHIIYWAEMPNPLKDCKEVE